MSAHACRMCVCVCVCVYRVSEGSTLCPEWKDLHFPQHGDCFNSLGAPKFLSIDYYQWKARPASEVGIAHTQYLHGNPREPEYCSVTAMMQWYMCQHMVEGRIIELRKGPIFGNFNPAKPKASSSFSDANTERASERMHVQLECACARAHTHTYRHIDLCACSSRYRKSAQ